MKRLVQPMLLLPQRRARSRLLLLLTLTSVLLGACSTERRPLIATLGVADGSMFPEPGEAKPIDPPQTLTDWTLPGSTGSDVSLHDFRGRFVLIFFGYTNCRDVCPTTMGEFKQVKQQLGAVADDVAFLFVSVDGERDTPTQLERYMKIFDPGFVGISGTFTSLEPYASEYGLYARKPGDTSDKGNYLVEHTAVTYLLDRQGRLTTIYGFGTSPRTISADIARLAQQS